MKWELRIELPQLLILAAMFAIAAILWPDAPEKIPVHWNAAGEVDRFGGKFEGLLGVPLLALLVYAILWAAPLIDAGRNIQSFRGAYNVLRFGILLFMLILYGGMMQAMHDQQFQMNRMVFLAVGGLFMLIGNVMSKLRPNWFAGIRTPWTLSSKLSWDKTHRLGGWLFLTLGAAIMACCLFPNSPAAIWVILGGAGISVLWLVIYSYLIWRNDPNRVPPAGTEPADESEERG